MDTMREGSMRAKVYGHRGARGERPENTLEGFLYARALGVAGIETDVAMTADLVPVLHHDAMLTDGRLIRDVNFADLDPSVISLRQALFEIPDMDWLLEVKTYPDAPGQAHAPDMVVRRVLAELEDIAPSRIYILAFDWAVLQAVAIQAPWLRRVCLTAPETAAARDVWWGPGFGGMTIPQAVAVSGAFGWAAYHAGLTEADIDEAKAAGLSVFAWTVNNREDFRRLAPLVDALITDKPRKFVDNCKYNPFL